MYKTQQDFDIDARKYPEMNFIRGIFREFWDLLFDNQINEIKISPYYDNNGRTTGAGVIWVNCSGVWSEPKDKNGKQYILSKSRIDQLIEAIAGADNKFAHAKQNYVYAAVPFLGHRFTGIKEPASVACPTFNIRIHSDKIFTLDDYVNKFKFFPEEVASYIDLWQHNTMSQGHYDKLSVCTYGITGCGKTGFQNFYVEGKRQLFPHENWVVAEDVYEMNLSYGCLTRLQLTEYHSLEEAVRAAKRLSPDNFVLGEVRGGEAALVVESAMIFNTVFGLHAKDFRAATSMLERLILKSEYIDKVDRRDLCVVNGWVGFQNIPFTTYDTNNNKISCVKKRLTEMTELYDYDSAKDEFQTTKLYTYDRTTDLDDVALPSVISKSITDIGVL